ncbi:hypothetical protein [Chromatium okenii]|jgi:hypothetical protein|uniref:hypothetical protein n=1 Tax=Chromatium okenii TaxID=61644 RepID=UPI0026ECF2F6|nr:hypothetical protein [Chromatium okenii]MBV5310806.1 hypothetical protein [Chromatium okenii]
MQITATKLTDIELLRRACDMTRHEGQSASTVSLAAMYRCEHSPIRTQLFWIEMSRIPTFVSVHLVRHSIGVTHYVESNRDDKGGKDTGRNMPVNHAMLINAQALMAMARKRLCSNAHVDTMRVMGRIKVAVADVDPDLAKAMVPDCVYRGGCHELKSCGARNE